MHYLSEKGRKHIFREHGWPSNKIHAPIGNSKFYKDYWHRRFTIDVHIALRTALESKGNDSNLKTVVKIFEKSLIGGFSESKDYAKIWMTFLEYKRRHLKYLISIN